MPSAVALAGHAVRVFLALTVLLWPAPGWSLAPSSDVDIVREELAAREKISSFVPQPRPGYLRPEDVKKLAAVSQKLEDMLAAQKPELVTPNRPLFTRWGHAFVQDGRPGEYFLTSYLSLLAEIYLQHLPSGADPATFTRILEIMDGAMTRLEGSKKMRFLTGFVPAMRDLIRHPKAVELAGRLAHVQTELLLSGLPLDYAMMRTFYSQQAPLEKMLDRAENVLTWSKDLRRNREYLAAFAAANELAGDPKSRLPEMIAAVLRKASPAASQALKSDFMNHLAMLDGYDEETDMLLSHLFELASEQPAVSLTELNRMLATLAMTKRTLDRAKYRAVFGKFSRAPDWISLQQALESQLAALGRVSPYGQAALLCKLSDKLRNSSPVVLANASWSMHVNFHSALHYPVAQVSLHPGPAAAAKDAALDLLNWPYGGGFLEAPRGSIGRVDLALVDVNGKTTLVILERQSSRGYWRLLKNSSHRGAYRGWSRRMLSRILETAEQLPGIDQVMSFSPAIAEQYPDAIKGEMSAGVVSEFYGREKFRPHPDYPFRLEPGAIHFQSDVAFKAKDFEGPFWVLDLKEARRGYLDLYGQKSMNPKIREAFKATGKYQIVSGGVQQSPAAIGPFGLGSLIGFKDKGKLDRLKAFVESAKKILVGEGKYPYKRELIAARVVAVEGLPYDGHHGFGGKGRSVPSVYIPWDVLQSLWDRYENLGDNDALYELADILYHETTEPLLFAELSRMWPEDAARKEAHAIVSHAAVKSMLSDKTSKVLKAARDRLARDLAKRRKAVRARDYSTTASGKDIAMTYEEHEQKIDKFIENAARENRIASAPGRIEYLGPGSLIADRILAFLGAMESRADTTLLTAIFQDLMTGGRDQHPSQVKLVYASVSNPMPTFGGETIVGHAGDHGIYAFIDSPEGERLAAQRLVHEFGARLMMGHDFNLLFERAFVQWEAGARAGPDVEKLALALREEKNTLTLADTLWKMDTPMRDLAATAGYEDLAALEPGALEKIKDDEIGLSPPRLKKYFRGDPPDLKKDVETLLKKSILVSPNVRVIGEGESRLILIQRKSGPVLIWSVKKVQDEVLALHLGRPLKASVPSVKSGEAVANGQKLTRFLVKDGGWLDEKLAEELPKAKDTFENVIERWGIRFHKRVSGMLPVWILEERDIPILAQKLSVPLRDPGLWRKRVSSTHVTDEDRQRLGALDPGSLLPLRDDEIGLSGPGLIPEYFRGDRKDIASRVETMLEQSIAVSPHVRVVGDGDFRMILIQRKSGTQPVWSVKKDRDVVLALHLGKPLKRQVPEVEPGKVVATGEVLTRFFKISRGILDEKLARRLPDASKTPENTIERWGIAFYKRTSGKHTVWTLDTLSIHKLARQMKLPLRDSRLKAAEFPVSADHMATYFSASSPEAMEKAKSLLPDPYRMEESEISLGGVRLFKRWVGSVADARKDFGLEWSAADADRKAIADYLGLRPIVSVPSLKKRETGVSQSGAGREYIGDPKKVANTIRALLEDVQTFPDNEIIRGGVRFFKRVSGSDLLWAYSDEDIERVGALAGLKVQPYIPKLGKGEVAVSLDGLARFFRGKGKWPHIMVRDTIAPFFPALDSVEGLETSVTFQIAGHPPVTVQCYKRMAGVNPVWAFKDWDCGTIARALNLWTKPLLPHVPPNWIPITEGRLGAVLYGEPNTLAHRAKGLLPGTGVDKVQKAVRDGVEFIQLRYRGRRTWAFHEKNLSKVAQLLKTSVKTKLQNVRSTEIVVSEEGLSLVFDEAKWKLTQKIKALLPDPKVYNASVFTIGDEIFYRRLDGKEPVWVFKEAKKHRFAEIFQTKLRPDAEVDRIRFEAFHAGFPFLPEYAVDMIRSPDMREKFIKIRQWQLEGSTLHKQELLEVLQGLPVGEEPLGASLGSVLLPSRDLMNKAQAAVILGAIRDESGSLLYTPEQAVKMVKLDNWAAILDRAISVHRLRTIEGKPLVTWARGMRWATRKVLDDTAGQLLELGGRLPDMQTDKPEAWKNQMRLRQLLRGLEDSDIVALLAKFTGKTEAEIREGLINSRAPEEDRTLVKLKRVSDAQVAQWRRTDKAAYDAVMVEIAPLLFSLRKAARIQAEHLLLHWHPDLLGSEYDDQMLSGTKKFNPYVYWAQGEPKIGRFDAYGLGLLRMAPLNVLRETVPAELRGVMSAYYEYRRQIQKTESRQASDDEIIMHLRGKGYSAADLNGALAWLGGTASLDREFETGQTAYDTITDKNTLLGIPIPEEEDWEKDVEEKVLDPVLLLEELQDIAPQTVIHDEERKVTMSLKTAEELIESAPVPGPQNPWIYAMRYANGEFILYKHAFASRPPRTGILDPVPDAGKILDAAA